MSAFSPERVKNAEGFALRSDARAALAAFEALLAHPVFEHKIDLSVLAKIATDEHAPLRERRRAAEVLLGFRMRAMDAVAGMTCVKEQTLDGLGLSSTAIAPTAVAVAQTVTKIEITREDDWRSAATSDGRGE